MRMKMVFCLTEDSATYERMEAEIEDLTKAIDRHRKAEEMEKSLNQPVNQR